MFCVHTGHQQNIQHVRSLVNRQSNCKAMHMKNLIIHTYICCIQYNNGDHQQCQEMIALPSKQPSNTNTHISTLTLITEGSKFYNQVTLQYIGNKTQQTWLQGNIHFSSPFVKILCFWQKACTRKSFQTTLIGINAFFWILDGTQK